MKKKCKHPWEKRTWGKVCLVCGAWSRTRKEGK